MSAPGLSPNRWRRSLLQRIAEAFPPPAQVPWMIVCFGLYALLVWMLLWSEQFVALVMAVMP